MSTRREPIGAMMLVMVGPIVWAIHFFTIYAMQTLACTHVLALDETTLPTAAMLVTLVAIVALVAFAAWRLFRPAAPLRHVSIALAGLSMLALLWVALPATLLPACTSAAA